MSNPTGIPSVPPGWYPDPTGAQTLRWWDGGQWTAHVQDPRIPVPPAQYAGGHPTSVPRAPGPYGAGPYNPAVYGATAYPQAAPRVPAIPKDPTLRVYTPFIWAILVLGAASVLSFSLFDMTAYIGSMRFQALGGASTTPFTPAYLTLAGVGIIIYAATAVFAFLDWRALRAGGMRAPFHWAWTFLNSGLYVIGRSVIANRRAGRGIAPMWIWIGFFTLTTIVATAKVAAAIGEIANYSSYTGA